MHDETPTPITPSDTPPPKRHGGKRSGAGARLGNLARLLT
jgi:hypothetical protein